VGGEILCKAGKNNETILCLMKKPRKKGNLGDYIEVG
jgi:hypothetical protein